MLEKKREYQLPTRILEALRSIYGYSQEYIAEYLGISAPSYSRKERGVTFFDTREINALLDLFKVPYDKIFKRPRRKAQERPNL